MFIVQTECICSYISEQSKLIYIVESKLAYMIVLDVVCRDIRESLKRAELAKNSDHDAVVERRQVCKNKE